MVVEEDLARKYLGRLEQGLTGAPQGPDVSSQEYKEFKERYRPRPLSLYERACTLCARIMPVAPDPKDRARLEEALRTCHLDVTPEGVISFSLLGPFALIVAFAIAGFLLPVLLGSIVDPGSGAYGSTFVLLFGLFTGLALIVPLQRLPYLLANDWRMRASNQMVLCVFYIVTYMRHTSNLELAIDFAAEHLAPPLALDLKKVLWDLETQRYGSVQESLDTYLDQWREWCPEFLESLHLIEGSLLEASDQRRLEMLDKSLSVMLDETYEKMLHYAHGLKSPLTTLHMLGIILPILGLVILPLMVNFIPEVRWYHMALVYNVALPVAVYLLARSILSTRPTGYGSVDITERNPELAKLGSVRIPLGGHDELRLSPTGFSWLIGAALVVIAISPIAFHMANPGVDYVWTPETGFAFVDTDSEEYGQAVYALLDYREVQPADGEPFTTGPNGIGATVLSLLLPLGIGLAVGIGYTMRTRNILHVREQTLKLEQEFAAALFQLGNRLADGLPAEIAFSKVAEVLRGTQTGRFFELVTINIAKLGMGLEAAIFDPRQGALLEYPSDIIASSMKVLVESSRKGPLIASQAVINVSEYIKQMHRVDERLRDLMSDVISSMKAQISFLTPVIAGIVIGITTMISGILGTIGTKLAQLQQVAGDAAGSALLSSFGQGGIATYHFQSIVGIYVVQITAILTIMVAGIEDGSDRLARRAALGRNLTRASALYVFVSTITIILFGIIAGQLVNVT